MRTSTKTLLLAVGILVLTGGHHVYGAVIYASPWRYHVAIFVLPTILALVAAHEGSQRWRETSRGRVSLGIFALVTLLIPLVAVGIFEGGYNHVLKNILYFVGASNVLLDRLYPPPTYEMPSDILFELTGIFQFLMAIWSTYYLLRLWREPRQLRISADSALGSRKRREEIRASQRPSPTIPLQPAGLSVKHSARVKSRMLATEARG